MNLNEIFSAKDHAIAYAQARTKADKSAIRDQIAAKASASKRVRWANLLKAIDAGDTERVKAYTLDGKAKAAAFKAIRESEKPAAPAKRKPAPKRTTRKAPAKSAKPNNNDADLNALAAKLEGMEDADLAAFFGAIMDRRARK